MRNVALVAAAAGTAAAFLGLGIVATHWFGDPAPFPTLTNAATAPDAEIVAKLDRLESALTGYRQAAEAQSRDQVADMNAQRRHFETAISAVQERLSAIEQTTVGTTDLERSDDAVQAQTEEDALEGPSNSEVTEANLAQWMDDTLRLGRGDEVTTEIVTEQTLQGLTEVPGIVLDDMHCETGFCRASLSHEAGEEVALGELYGTPPFDGEGFTIEGPDGQVLLYFTQSGESLDTFREEARLFGQLFGQ
jgi:hypothetical protein